MGLHSSSSLLLKQVDATDNITSVLAKLDQKVGAGNYDYVVPDAEDPWGF
jgi:hypothetical protein